MCSWHGEHYLLTSELVGLIKVARLNIYQGNSDILPLVLQRFVYGKKVVRLKLIAYMVE